MRNASQTIINSNIPRSKIAKASAQEDWDNIAQLLMRLPGKVRRLLDSYQEPSSSQIQEILPLLEDLEAQLAQFRCHVALLKGSDDK